MKKFAKIFVRSLIGLILFILVVLFTVPVIFKQKIKSEAEKMINSSVNATVSFKDFQLTFFRNFPNLSFSLKEMTVTGKDKFEGDTLAGFKSFDLIFNLASLFSKSGYEVKSILVDRAVVNAMVSPEGKANWDITLPADTASLQASREPESKPEPKPDAAETADAVSEGSESGSMKIMLRRFEIKNSSITYSDLSSKIAATVGNLDFSLSGNMTLSSTDLDMKLEAGDVTVEMDGVRYLRKASVESEIMLMADLDSMKFRFGENYFRLNDLILNFTGEVAMPGDDISADVSFGTSQTSFKTLLSLVPAVYMTGYESLVATGDFKLEGTARGIYSEADSTIPDISLNLNVSNGLISYPDLPEKITSINITSDLFVDGSDMDMTTVKVDRFHFELAGNPFDMTLMLKTPVSDPDFRATMNGKIDLAALSRSVPMDSINLSGIIEMALSMSGKMSMIEKEQYDSFNAKGTLSVKDMIAAMQGYPRVDIREASFLITPAYTAIQKSLIVVEGKSDFSLTGNLENYIPYLFRNETVKGRLNLYSKRIDATSIMNAMAEDTSAVESPDTVALVVIAVPKNIEFDFNALIDEFTYDRIRAEKMKGHIIVKDGILSVRETGMNILGGSVVMNADYDTRDTLKPSMRADMNISDIEIKDAYSTFMTIEKFAPTAKGIRGKINMQLKYESLLGSDMLPVMQSINGSGKLQSDEVQLVESVTFDKFKQVLKLGDKYSNTFRDINISFKIRDGRIYADPFNVKLGNIKMNIAGDQGLDQTINYLIKTEIPRSDLGTQVNSLIDNLSAQASAFGLAFKPADVLKVNVRVKGTFTRPEVAPDFGGGGGGSTAGGTTQGAVKQTVDNAVEKSKEQLREEAAKQGDRLIQEAEVQGQKLREEALRAAQRLKQEADSAGARLIKSAESKNIIAKSGAQKGAEALRKEADRQGLRLIQEADVQAVRLVEEAKAQKEALINKL